MNAFRSLQNSADAIPIKPKLTNRDLTLEITRKLCGTNLPVVDGPPPPLVDKMGQMVRDSSRS